MKPVNETRYTLETALHGLRVSNCDSAIEDYLTYLHAALEYEKADHALTSGQLRDLIGAIEGRMPK